MLADGITMICKGQEQHYSALGGSTDPYNREAIWLSGYNTTVTLYRLIKTLNSLRSTAIAADTEYLSHNTHLIYSDRTAVDLRKGSDGKQVITVLSNSGANGDNYTLSLSDTGWENGDKVVDVLTCTTMTVSSDSSSIVPIDFGLPRAYYPSGLAGSLC